MQINAWTMTIMLNLLIGKNWRMSYSSKAQNIFALPEIYAISKSSTTYFVIDMIFYDFTTNGICATTLITTDIKKSTKLLAFVQNASANTILFLSSYTLQCFSLLRILRQICFSLLCIFPEIWYFMYTRGHWNSDCTLLQKWHLNIFLWNKGIKNEFCDT